MIIPCPCPLDKLRQYLDRFFSRRNHEHDDYAIIDHNHDERYYTQSEVDDLISSITPGIEIVGYAEQTSEQILPASVSAVLTNLTLNVDITEGDTIYALAFIYGWDDITSSWTAWTGEVRARSTGETSVYRELGQAYQNQSSLTPVNLVSNMVEFAGLTSGKTWIFEAIVSCQNNRVRVAGNVDRKCTLTLFRS